MLLETDDQQEVEAGTRIASALLNPSADGVVQVLISNSHLLTHKIPEGTEIGGAVPVEIVEPADPNGEQPHVYSVGSGSQSHDKHRKELPTSLLQPHLSTVPEHERRQLVNLLEKYRNTFSLLEGERGEAALTEMSIETGDATPKRQPARRVPFALRQEVAKQLAKMQKEGVIQPSSSPWASAIVLVRKKDGGLRICVDYHQLNSVTKLDTFPLPRIDDLLDQLGSAKYLTTLDLAAGYWQIRVADDSIEKTAFKWPV